MEKNLLQKEEEFHKLNAELELKTKELLKEVEDVMVCTFFSEGQFSERFLIFWNT
jgi:hypothetical protein